MSLADEVHVGVAESPDLRTATEREADDNAALGRAHADLVGAAVALAEMCREGTFYQDYDESTAAIGRVDAAVRALAVVGEPEWPGERVAAAKAALLAEPWGTDKDRSWASHANHRYDASCAICRGDIDAILAVAVRALRSMS